MTKDLPSPVNQITNRLFQHVMLYRILPSDVLPTATNFYRRFESAKCPLDDFQLSKLRENNCPTTTALLSDISR